MTQTDSVPNFYQLILLQMQVLQQMKDGIVPEFLDQPVFDTQQKFRIQQTKREMNKTHLTNSRMRKLHNVHQPRGQNH